jgi:tripartite ATP-independent transporter DctP family solute receptor
MRRSILFLLAAAFLSTLSNPAISEVLKLKFHHVGQQGSIYDIAATEYARRVNGRLKGVAEVVVYGASQLGDDTAALQKLKTGEIAIATPSSVMTSVDDRFGIFEMPFLIRNRTHIRRVRAAILEPFLKPAVKANGYLLLAMWEDGFRHITNNVRPINTPADLKDIKLRVPKGIWRVKMFEAYGTKAVPMAFNEVYEGLKSNRVDGQENPLTFIDSSKFYEVQKYLSLSNHVYFPSFFLVSEKHFAKLPPKVRKILSDTAVNMQDWVLEEAGKLEQRLITKLSAYMTVNEADPLAFTIESRKIYQDYAKTSPKSKLLIKTVYDLTPKS